MKTKQINYNDLDNNLKEEVRQNLREDEFLVPDDWYEFVLDDVNDNEKWIGITLDRDKIEFDLYRDTMIIEGDIDLDKEPFKKYLTDEYHLWVEKGWIEDFPTEFQNQTLDDSLYIDEDKIFEEIEDDIFGGEIDLDDDGDILFNKSIIDRLKKAFEKYNEDFPNEAKILNDWVTEIETAVDIFFQDNITVPKSNYELFLSDIAMEMRKNIEDVLESIQEKINWELEDFYFYLKNKLRESYDYYFSDEYLDEILSDKTFEVVIDDDGNQSEIIDLDGTY